MFNLRNRSFLKELDFTPAELRFLLKLSAELKAAKYGGYEQPRLAGIHGVAMAHRKDEGKGQHGVPASWSVEPLGHEDEVHLHAAARTSETWRTLRRLISSYSDLILST